MVFSISDSLGSASIVWISPNRRRGEPRQAQRRRGPPGQRHGRLQCRAGDREGDDLDGGDDGAGRHHPVRGNGGDGDGFVDRVDRIDPFDIDHRETRRGGAQAGAAGKRVVDGEALPANRRGEPGGGLVLADIARLEPGHDDFPVPRAADRRDVVRSQKMGPS